METDKLTSFDVIIVGGGPAGLICAHFCALKGKRVAVLEAKNRVGRKFLVAGDGGLNLSNTQEIEAFVSNYSNEYVINCVRNFDVQDLRNWMSLIGVETFVGSSGKIFPAKGIKPAQVLQAILDALSNLKVTIFTNHEMVDFDSEQVYCLDKIGKTDITKTLSFKKLVFALGGASWSKTGSTGAWKDLFISKGIQFSDFEASNAGFNVAWKSELLPFFGSVLQNVNLTLGEKQKFGNLTITDYGVEGTPVYWLNSEFREKKNKELHVDFLPNCSLSEIEHKLVNSAKISEVLRSDFKLKKPVMALLKLYVNKTEFINPLILAQKIKAFKIELLSLRPIDEAISTVGGISKRGINTNAQLVGFNNVYITGEMLDWDAPTGGYLLHACFAMGVAVAREME